MEYISKNYFKKIKKKILLLQKKKKEIIKSLSEAVEKGDLSENYEYFAIKEEYNLLLIKINKLKNILLNSKIFNFNKKKRKNNKIFIFSKITLKNLNNNKIYKYTIVYDNEANINKNKISYKTPIASKLLGKKKGKIIKISKLNIKYKILKIE